MSPNTPGPVARPKWPKLAEARAAVEGIRDVREAWEAVASRGLIPQDWIWNERRAFGMSTAIGERRLYYPPTIASVVAFAADTQAVLAAEEIARQLTAMSREPRDRILWWVERQGPLQNLNGAMLPDGATPEWMRRLDELGQLGYALRRVTPTEVVLVALEAT